MLHSLSNYVYDEGPHTALQLLSKRHEGAEGGSRVAFIILIPVLVILSGIFAGLTLGYMSLDETQLNVLSTSGTEKQKKYAAQIIPIRKNGHLLLITLILANMITNETLPVVSDQVLPGSVYGVIISTALIVVFAEIIPQTVCTRYGLVIGAKMAFIVRCLIILFWPISFPIAKFLEWVLGPHHGIIYRRSELKELIAMHADDHPQGQGGELKHDTAAIIGHTLDLQEKVVSDAMTSVDKVFMLCIDSVLDYATLTKIHKTGHSRIPVYEELELGVAGKGGKTEKVKKIVGVLLVKQCVLLDPEDATPLRTIPLNKVPAIAHDEPLLKVLDRFQEGRSHIAIVTRLSSKRAASVKEVVKPALTKRFLNRFRDSDSSSSDDDEDLEKGNGKKKGDKKDSDIQNGNGGLKMPSLVGTGKALEQTMPADALLPKANAEKWLQNNFDPYTSPLGIITLEDVLEELIGEEIYDEFDLHGAQALPASTYLPPEAQAAVDVPPTTVAAIKESPTTPKSKPAALKVPLKMGMPSFTGLGGLGILRTRSAPGTPRGTAPSLPATNVGDAVVEKLEHIKEVHTPSPTEKEDPHAEDTTTDAGTFMEKEKDGESRERHDKPAERRSTLDSPPVYGPVPEINIENTDNTNAIVERVRSSSTPPSPAPNKIVLPPATGPITPTLSMQSGRVNSPPSLLTEAVLRGRQARLGLPLAQVGITGIGTPSGEGVASGTATPVGDARGRPTVKGRFKSQRLTGAPPSPPLTSSKKEKDGKKLGESSPSPAPAAKSPEDGKGEKDDN